MRLASVSRLFLASVGLCAALFLTSAAAPAQDKKADNPAVKPADKLSAKNWADRHQRFLDIAKKGNVDVLFLGDSITQGWEGEKGGKEAWKRDFEPLKAAN